VRLNRGVDELPGGIRRLTFPLPLGIDHVHCYLLPGSHDWLLVDTGLGLPGAAARWAAALDGLEVARIVITHFHPDHAGGGEDVRALTGATVHQGADDYEQCVRVWGTDDWSERLADYLRRHGLPDEAADELRPESSTFGPFIRFARDPELLREGDEVDG
jgi:glyoxylase-like metal-dependent hydrolase (beta-lactamase superfamily II)